MISRQQVTTLLAGSAAAALLAGGAQAAEPGAAIEEVVVTARKVTENVQDVPISMSAISGERLERARITTVESLNNIAPNVKVFKTANNSDAFAVYIRGVGRNNGSFLVEAPVALYVDDVIYPVQVGAIIDTGGVARVEVLRGPQGTLYGRNATNGAVKYVMRRPSLTATEGQLALTAGSYGRYEAQTSIGLPMVEGALGLKFDFSARQYEGYLYDRTSREHVNGTTSFSGRLGALWQVAEDIQVYAAIDGTVARDPLTLNVPVVLNAATGRFEPRFGDYYTTDHAAPDLNDLDVAGATVQATWDTGPAVIKSVTAFRVSDLKYASDPNARSGIVYTGLIQNSTDNTFTQEVQATGGFGDRFKYVAGVFYLHSLTKVFSDTPGVAVPATNYTRQLSRSGAIYVDGTFEVLDGLHVSAGVRTLKDKKKIFQNRLTTATQVHAFDVVANKQWTSTTPRVSVDYSVTDDILIYANWGKGFKGGQVSAVAPTTRPTAAQFVPPEKTTNKEIGTKTEWFDRRLQVNVDYFWTDYDNQAQAIIGVGGANELVSSDAKVSGLEIEARARPIPAWMISASVGTLHSKYVNVQPGHPVFTLTDKTLQHAPKLTYNLGTDYTIEGVFGGSLLVGGNYEHVAATFQCLTHAPVCNMPAYHVVGVNAIYTLPNDRYQFILAGTNVTGTKYFKLGSTNNTWAVAPPDEWSVTFRARW